MIVLACGCYATAMESTNMSINAAAIAAKVFEWKTAAMTKIARMQLQLIHEVFVLDISIHGWMQAKLRSA